MTWRGCQFHLHTQLSSSQHHSTRSWPDPGTHLKPFSAPLFLYWSCYTGWRLILVDSHIGFYSIGQPAWRDTYSVWPAHLAVFEDLLSASGTPWRWLWTHLASVSTAFNRSYLRHRPRTSFLLHRRNGTFVSRNFSLPYGRLILFQPGQGYMANLLKMIPH